MGAKPVVAALSPRDLGQPYGCFDGFDLAEERGDRLELVVTPVDEQALGCRRDTPVGRVGDCPPAFDIAANFVDEAVDVVLLGRGRKVLGVPEHERGLSPLGLLLPGLGNRRDQLRPPAPGHRGQVERLPVGVQRVMPGRHLVRGVEDGLIEEG